MTTQPIFRAAALAALALFATATASHAQGLGGMLHKAARVGDVVPRNLLASAPAKSSRRQTAPAEPVPTASPADETDDSAAPARRGGTSSGVAAARPSAAPAAAKPTVWVCTWCKQEYTSDKTPTSFEPGKCPRNPGKAHAWRKK